VKGDQELLLSEVMLRDVPYLLPYSLTEVEENHEKP